MHRGTLVTLVRRSLALAVFISFIYFLYITHRELFQPTYLIKALTAPSLFKKIDNMRYDVCAALGFESVRNEHSVY